MKVTKYIDRKLMLVVVGPLVRHLANALSLYLAGQGLNTGLINQVEAGVIAAATLAINVLFELRDQGKVAESAAFKATGATERAATVLSSHAIRERFERESG